MLYMGKFRSVSLLEMQQLQSTLLNEKNLQEKVGDSISTLFSRSVQILARLFSRQLSNQTDVRVAVFESILNVRLTPGS